MSDSKKKKTFLYADHEKPMTRRQFLAAGLADSVVLAGMPTILQLLLSRTAQAETAAPNSLFFIRDTSGGDAGTSHYTFLPRMANGGLPDSVSLDNMGLPGNMLRNTPGTITEEYGAPMRTGIYYQHLAANLPEAVRQRMAIGVILYDSPDDTRAGQQGIIGAAINAYLTAKNPTSLLIQGAPVVMPANLSFELDAGGLYSKSPSVLMPLESYVAVQAQNALEQALRPPFASLQSAPNAAANVLTALQQLATSRQARLKALDELALAKDAADSYGRYRQNIQTGAALDISAATLAPNVRSMLAAAGSAEATRFAAALAAARLGVCRPQINMVLSGGDHHDGSDIFAASGGSTGDFIRRALRLDEAAILQAAADGRNVVIIRIGDGAMRANPNPPLSNKVYTSDERRYSQIVITVYYGTRMKPAMPRTVVGACTADGFNRMDGEVTSPAAAGAIAFANALYAIGETDVQGWVRKVIPRTIFDDKLVPGVRMFG